VANKKYLPYVVEPALGLNRLFLAVMSDAYAEEKLEGDEMRTVLRFQSKVAPVKVAIFPLMKKDGLDVKAKEIYHSLMSHWYVDYDDSAAIGKRYRRHDEIGTPFCITVDYDTLKDNTVTLRERDSMKQERIAIADIPKYLLDRIK
jgi:glycyl-tRNA synthetase